MKAVSTPPVRKVGIKYSYDLDLVLFLFTALLSFAVSIKALLQLSMKFINLVFSAMSFASVAIAQNGNDPLILNNRTGLAPVVYDTFSISYTTKEPFRSGVSVTRPISVPVTPSPMLSNTYFRSNTYFPKPTTSIECWRDGYPCGQNGGQRSQRRVAKFIRATSSIDEVQTESTYHMGYMVAARRIPPPEFFSTRSDVNLPHQTADVPMNILPIPAKFTDGTHYDAPNNEPGETGDVNFSILPIPTPTEARHAVIPTEWWRGPGQSDLPMIPPGWWRDGASPSHTHECSHHYCPTNDPSHTHGVPTSHGTYPTVHSTKLSAVPPKVTAGAEFHEAGVPIDWWRGPGQPIIPDSPVGPIQRHSSHPIESERHYCPTNKQGIAKSTIGFSTVPVVEPTDYKPCSTLVPLSKTTLSTFHGHRDPASTSLMAMPPKVSTQF